MSLLFNIIAGVIVVIAAVFLPRLYRQKRAERLARIQKQAEEKQLRGTLSPAALTRRKELTRKGNRMAQFVYVLFFFSFFFYFYTFNWLDDLAVRLLTTRSQELRIFRYSLVECAVLMILIVLYRELRNHPANRLKSITASLFGTLPIIFYTWAFFDFITAIVLYHSASEPATIAGTVTHSGRRSEGKVTKAFYARIQPFDGGKEVNVKYFSSLHAWVSGYAIRVNGECRIQDLPSGLPVVLHGRRSEFGFALDEITSDAPCSQHLH